MPVFDCATGIVRSETAGEIAARLPPLAEARAAARADLKAARDAASATSMTPLGLVDSDLASLVKITGAVQLAQLAIASGQTFSVTWTMADNSNVHHDADQMIALGLAAAAHIAACHSAYQHSRAQIDAAADHDGIADALASVVWP